MGKSKAMYVAGKGLQLTVLKKKHLRLLDLMLTNPHLKNKEIAAMAGVTPAWASQVINSELFQQEYKRQYEVLRARRDAGILGKLYDAAEIGIDASIEILQKEDSSDTAKNTATKNMLTALGFGSGGAGSVSITNNTQVNSENAQVVAGVDKSEMELARERRNQRLSEQAGEVFEHGQESEDN